jgi:hypothetical protein
MENIGLIIAIVGTGIAMVGVVIAMMFWCRSEANSLRNEAKEDRKDFLQLIRCIEISINEIKSENKDFHYRLLEIEKKRG